LHRLRDQADRRHRAARQDTGRARSMSATRTRSVRGQSSWPVTPSEPPTSSPGLARAQAQVYPGQVHAAIEPTVVRIVLGSCVTMCLWDPRMHLGGANHCLLPSSVEGGGMRTPKFADVACEKLLAKVEALGSRRRDLRARVYGGASLFESFRRGGQSLGERN